MRPAPRVLCRGWRSSTLAQMPCASGGVVQPGDPGGAVIEGGMCRLCKDLNARASEAAWGMTSRKLLRNRAQGYGGPKQGEDVFRGFREAK